MEFGVGYNNMYGREYSASTKRVLEGVDLEPSYNNISMRSGSANGSDEGSLLTSNCTT